MFNLHFRDNFFRVQLESPFIATRAARHKNQQNQTDKVILKIYCCLKLLVIMQDQWTLSADTHNRVEKDVGMEIRKVQQQTTASGCRPFLFLFSWKLMELGTSNLFPCQISKVKPENATIDCFQDMVDDPCLVPISLDFPISLMMSGR